MDIWTLVSSESDVADFALLLGLDDRFHASASRENALRIVVTDYFMKLHQVDVVGLKPAQRFFDLLGGGLLRSAVDLGHQESLLPIAVTKGFTHADFALAAVVIPTVV